MDEVDEHHAVEHQRGVPFAVGHFLDTLNEAEKVLMLVLETVVEFLGYFLDIEGSEHVAGDVYDREVGLIFEREDNPFQLLDEGFAALVGSVDMGARAVRPARFTFDPQPVLGAAVVGGEDDDMFSHLLGDPSFDLLAGGMVGEVGAGLGEIPVGDHTAFVGDGLEGVGAVFNSNFGVAAAVIPAKLLSKEIE